MCNPIIAAALAIGQGISEYQTASAIAKHSDKVADAQIAASYKARDDSARMTNAQQEEQQMQVADQRQETMLEALRNREQAKVAALESGAEGRSIDLSLIERENRFLKYDTGVARTIDSIQTAFAYKREGLDTQLTQRIMQADAGRKPKPSLAAALIKTAANATMAYGSANGGFGKDTASFGENMSNLWPA
jgi:hypothetical protein